MSRIRVIPIVEGHGEVESIRVLLERIWREVVGGEYIEVVQPIRRPKSKLVTDAGLDEAIGLAEVERAPRSYPTFVLLLLDADESCPAMLATGLRKIVQRHQDHLDVAIVIANVEYETWFVAAADAKPLADRFDLARITLTQKPGRRQARQRLGPEDARPNVSGARRSTSANRCVRPQSLP